MNEIKLFRFGQETALELKPAFASLERDLHRLLEKHLESFFSIRMLAREFGTGKIQRGHIDTLGLDENNCPVIIEYKRRRDDNVITQALYYLDWLLDHRADFLALASERLGVDAATKIEFAWPRLICVASEFSRFDERAVNRIGYAIELVRYKFFEDNMLLLERLNSAPSPFPRGCEARTEDDPGQGPIGMPPPLQARIKSMSADIENIYFQLLAFSESLGEDVSVKFLKHYIALSRLRNFTSIQPARNSLKVWVNLDPDQVMLEGGFSRDVREIGHLASGNLELELRQTSDLEKALPLIKLAYENN